MVLTAISAHAGNVTLAWDPSPDSTVVGYKIYYGTASGVYTMWVDVGNTTSAAISNLTEDVTYYFAATAYDITGLESDYSTEISYVIANQPPTVNQPANLTIGENASRQTVSLGGISAGAATESQTLTVKSTSSNTNLIPTPAITYTSPNSTGTLSFAPATNQFGSATITISVDDGSRSNHLTTVSFVVTVTAPSGNQQPTLNQPANLTINENTGVQTVSLTGISSGATNEAQTLSVSASSSNTKLISNPSVTYTSPAANGTLSFTPVTNSFGSATITVTVNDGGLSNNVVSRTFTVTVAAVNQQPTLNSLTNLTISENTGVQTVSLTGISSGATNEAQTLSVSASSSNTGLIPNPTVTYTSPAANSTLSFTPAANSFGSATITVTVNDGGLSNNVVTRTFTVTVDAPPTITAITNISMLADTQAGPVGFTVGDADTAATNLVVSAWSTNTSLIPTTNIVLGGSASNRTVTLTPIAKKTGNSLITLIVSDGFACASNSFLLTVRGLSSPGSFHIQVQGSGTVTPNLTADVMTEGDTYTVTAVPNPGSKFVGWSGSTNSSSPTLSFVFSSNLSLTANFETNSETVPYVLAQAKFQGLFYASNDVDQANSGAFSLTTTKAGKYSGIVQLGSTRYSISGTLDSSGEATNIIKRAKTNLLTLALQLGAGSLANQVSGSLVARDWTNNLYGDRLDFNAKTNPCAWAGRYTLRLPSTNNDPLLPEGDGFGSATVSSSGAVSLAGTLPDGTKFSQSAFVSTNGDWPLYVPLYSSTGLLLGWLGFEDRNGDDIHGLTYWFKTTNLKNRYYPSGFTNNFQTVASAYLKPMGATNHILALTNALVGFSGGNLSADFTNAITLLANSRVSNLSTNRLSLSFNLTTGTFTGTVTDPSSRKNMSFSGATFQKLNAASGLLLGTNLSSRVSISEPAP